MDCPHLLSVAPMMDRTDRHFRYLIRQMTRRALLHTEMVTTPAIIHGDRPKLLDFSSAEHPISLQLGGDQPEELARCATIGKDWGYDEINLNVGCPSPRVQKGNFGACLMAQPELVADCVAAMQSAVKIPVTVKHRIGVDNQDSYEDLCHFVETVAETGCTRFSVHARKAWLKGLSPKENRTVPPLRYEDVYRLKKDFPQLWIEINGGITNIEQTQAQLKHVDAVMIGRAAYDNPYSFATVDRDIYGEDIQPKTRHEIVEAMLPYIDSFEQRGLRLHSISRHMLTLFLGKPGTKAWKRYITEEGRGQQANRQVIEKALALVPQ
ncbi:MAG: tRNA dihydrouridine(20/20a) synthase DusA [Limnothrix sp.]